MTLIELLILLAIVFVVVFIALPTLNPVRTRDVERFARKHLLYLYERERAYFLRNGHYQSFAVLAKVENGGPFLDRRYTGTEYRERGVVFKGPEGESSELLLTAELPGGKKFLQVDAKGRITEHKGSPSAESAATEQPGESAPPAERPEAETPPPLVPPKEPVVPDGSPPETRGEPETVSRPALVRGWSDILGGIIRQGL